MFTRCKTFAVKLISPRLVLAVNGDEKVDAEDAGVAGDAELFVDSVVLLTNRTIGDGVVFFFESTPVIRDAKRIFGNAGFDRLFAVPL